MHKYLRRYIWIGILELNKSLESFGLFLWVMGESSKVFMLHTIRTVYVQEITLAVVWTGEGGIRGRESRGYFIQQVRDIKRIQELVRI